LVQPDRVSEAAFIVDVSDADLATFYDVPTKQLNEQVKRNAKRCPAGSGDS
jgi:hypothetical protein